MTTFFHATFFSEKIMTLRSFSHFGTLKAALDRLFSLNEADRLVRSAWVYGANLQVSNFVEVRDVGWPRISGVAIKLHEYFKQQGNAAASEEAWKCVPSEATEAVSAYREAKSRGLLHKLPELGEERDRQEGLVAERLAALTHRYEILGLHYSNDVEDAGMASYVPSFPVRPSFSIQLAAGLNKDEAMNSILRSKP